MENCEFYLSKGWVGQLVLQESLFDLTKQRDSSYETATSIRLSPTPILCIVDFQKFSSVSPERYGMIISDGNEQIRVTIDQSLNYCAEFNINQRYLRLGSVIVLKSYKIIRLIDFLRPEEITPDMDENKPVICLTDLLLIGRLNESLFLETSPKDEFERNSKIQEINDPDLNQIYTINELIPLVSKSKWGFKCILVSKSLVREYENRKTGIKGRLVRFLFSDNTAKIEVVAFNDFCDKFESKNLQPNCGYILKNGDIKLANSLLKAWPHEISVKYEVHVNKWTEIENFQLNIEMTGDSTIVFAPKEGLEIKGSNEERLDYPKQLISPCINKKSEILHSKFTRLSQLITKPTDSFVDVVVIIDEVGPLKKMNSTSSLSLRNISVVDQSNLPVSVALWGKQAEQFSHVKGTCLIMNKIKISTYGGISLSVMRTTEVMELKSTYDIPIATELIEWWSTCKRYISEQEDENKNKKFKS